ncbi:MAG: NmrA/HSCARG family protein [Bacteroidota bacterium]
MDKKTIVVCGATGKQGGAVIESLLKKQHWNVVALSRNLEGDKATALRKRGVKVMKADLQDRASLVSAFRGAKGVFGVTQPWSSDYKKCYTDAEIVQGHNIVDACNKASVEHLIISSVVHLDMKHTGVTHVDSKIAIENYLKQSKVPHTLLRLASFMDNIGADFFPVKRRYVRGLTDKNVKVIYIACKDIGEFAAIAFEQPDKYLNKDLDLIADFISGEELAETLGKIRKGEYFKYKSPPKFLLKIFAKEFYEMRLLFENWGRPPYPEEFSNAIKKCKEIHPGIMTVEEYLLSKGYDVKQL